MLTLERPTDMTPTDHVTNQVPYGPLVESGQLSAGLDYYKLTMSQLAYELEPDAEVTFTFHNRGEQRLLDYVDPNALQHRLDDIRQHGWQPAELDYLASLKNSAGDRFFSDSYLGYLQTNELPRVDVKYNAEIDDIEPVVTGPHPLSTFWETIVMSEINEAYFEGYVQVHGLDPLALYQEGDRRTGYKADILKAHPEIQFLEFGTRRRYSLRWQGHTIQRFLDECPKNIIGTSNVALARKLGIKASGTFAHEDPMVYAGLADARGEDIRASHHQFLEDWYARYGQDLSIALTDTFGSKFFFSDFTREQAQAWRGVRHDSGDPIEFGERLLKFYEDYGIDPKTKTVIFSDGLDIDQIVKLQEHFEGRINILFGWGTTLTNDLGLKPLNIVMKATHVRDPQTGLEADTVKLSDNEGKHTGSPENVARYLGIFATN